MKGFNIAILALLLVSCNAEKVTKVTFVSSLNDDALAGTIKVNGQKLDLSGRTQESFEVEPIYPRNITFDLDYSHDREFYANSKNDLAATQIKMKFNLKSFDEKTNEVSVKKSGSVKLQGKKYKLTNCTNTVEFKPNGSELIIDMTKFKSLASCNLVGKYKNHNRVGEEGRLHNGFGRNFFKYETDEQFGKEAVMSLYSSLSGYIYRDGEMAEQLQAMLDNIAAASDKPNIKPTVYFVNAPIENAFALPGGYVFVFRGLIESLETEAELAGVLGHEWAHVTERHGTESVTRNLKSLATKYVGAGLIWANFGFLGAAASYYVYDKLEDIPLMGFSRLQELEADKLGVQYAHRAGYSPYGLSKFFAQAPDREETLLELLTSTHPKSSTRVEKIEELVFNYIPYVEDAVVTSDDYAAAKESIKELEQMPYYVVQDLMRTMGALVDESIKKSVRKKLKITHKLDKR